MSSQRRLVTTPVLPAMLTQDMPDGGLHSIYGLLMALDKAQAAGDLANSVVLVEQVYAAYDLAAEVYE